MSLRESAFLPPERLTPVETQVLALADAGQSVKWIAVTLGMSVRSVEERLKIGRAKRELAEAIRADQEGNR